MEFVVVMFAIIWVAGQLLPWIILSSRGIRISFLDYSCPLIQKNILAINHNNKVFDALQIIQSNQLEISVRELDQWYRANMDFNKIVDAMLLAKNRNINVSKDTLLELAYLKKDLMSVINTKNAGEEVMVTEVIPNYVDVKRLPVLA